MAYPITEIQGIGTDIAAILKSDGIRTTVSLLRSAKTPKQRLKLARKTGADEKLRSRLGDGRRPHAHQGRRLGLRANSYASPACAPSTNFASAIRSGSRSP